VKAIPSRFIQIMLKSERLPVEFMAIGRTHIYFTYMPALFSVDFPYSIPYYIPVDSHFGKPKMHKARLQHLNRCVNMHLVLKYAS